MDSSLLIQAKNKGKAVKKNIPNLNPNLNSDDAKTLAQLITGLSQDAYQDAHIINKFDVNDTDSPFTYESHLDNHFVTADAESLGNGIRLNIFGLNGVSYGFIDVLRR